MDEAPTTVRGELPPPSKMLPGRTVYRVVWQLNTDILVGYCWCGTPHEATDPIELWQWLLAHPEQHGSAGASPAEPPAPTGARPDVLVRT